MIDLLREQEDLRRRLEQTAVRESITSITGSWTPTLVGAGTAGTFTYAVQGAEYARIGNRVFYNGRFQITAVTVAPVGNMTINGLPFTAVAGSHAIAGGGELMDWQGLTLPAGFTHVACQINDTTTKLFLLRNGSGQAGAVVQGAEVGLIGGAIDLRFAGHYRCA